MTSATPDEAFFAALGRLTLSWAHLEFGLDAAISIIHQRLGGDNIEPEVPIHLARKVKYLKRSIRRLAPLSAYQATAIPMLEQIAQAVEFRKNAVHGVVVSHSTTSEAEVVRLLHSKDGHHTEKRLSVSTLSILKASDDASKLAAQTTEFALDLANRLLK